MNQSIPFEKEAFVFSHVPVLSQELIQGLSICPDGHYLDATVGGGGHSQSILAIFPSIKITAIDRDGGAIAAAKEKLKEYGEDRVNFWQGNFADYKANNATFDGIIADLGVSSPQLDQAERGFSFRQDAPLDMRMDRNQSLTAADIINEWKEVELAKIFFEYGEERLSRRIARQIIENRPFRSTLDLANAIANCVPSKYRYARIHPATRTFQGLRIAVNDELGSLERFIEQAPHWLKIGGKIGIISFHSLEDRIVKHRFRESALLKVISKKPVIAQPEEEKRNPRSRSAKLRFAERSQDL